MLHVRDIAVMALILIVLSPVRVAAIEEQETVGDGATYGSHRHYNLINLPERQAWSSVSEFGGSMKSGLFGGAHIWWRLTDRRIDFVERELRNTDFSLTARTKTGWIGLRVPIAGGRAMLDVQSGVSSPETAPARALYDLHLKASPVEMAAVDIRIGTRMEIIALDGIFWGENIALNIPAVWNYSEFEGRIRLLPALTVRLGYRDMGLSEPDPDRGLEFSSGLSGAAEFRYQGIRFGEDTGAHIQITAHQLDVSGKLNLLSRGVRFGQIAGIDADIDWYRIEGRPPIADHWLELKLDYLTGSGEAAGHIEGWPFTDPLEDLLGIRRNFKGTAEIELWRVSGAAEFRPTANWNLHTQLDLYRLYPDLRFADWRPTFMVFGVQDMDRYRDDHDRIDFGRLQLEISRAIGRITVGGKILQLFPIRIKKQSDPDFTEIGQPVSRTPASGPDRKKDGGRSIQIRVGYRL